jgi:hypothetical protein
MTLTPAQLTTFKADIEANTDPVIVQALLDGAVGVIASWYNEGSTFWVWRPDVSAAEIGSAVNLKDLGNIISANSERITTAFTLVNSNGGQFHGDRTDHRAFFADMFSGANGATTRPIIRDAWQRLATEIEKLFATGTGTQATGEIDDGTGVPAAGDPGELVFEGVINTNDVIAALNS